MRRFSALVIVISACSGTAPAVRAVKASAPPASAAPNDAPSNTTSLVVELQHGPVGQARVRFVAPTAGARVALADARNYEVRWVGEQLDPDALGVDVALDAERPRRLPASATGVALGLLVPTGEELTAGEHWLFAAPISASGLVPRRAEGAPASAVAVRFRIGDAPGRAAAGGVVWLRKPEGTYNGVSSEHVLFDALAFSESGEPLSTRCTIHVRGKLDGELRFSGPFSAVSLPNGDYELGVSALGVPPAPVRFVTVNAELGRPK